MQNGEIVRQTVGTVFDMWQKLAFTGVLVSSFILLFQNKRFSKAVDSLRFYGKMSLTNYIIQSIVGAIIYFPFGLYLAPYCGAAASLLITRVRDKNFMIFNQAKDIEYWAAFQGRLIYLYSLVLLIPEDKLPV